jgi:predicted Zn-dependent protease
VQKLSILSLLPLVICFFFQPAYIEGQPNPNPNEEFTLLDEYYLGRAVAANILSVYRPYRNTEATQYLNRICQAIVINSNNPPTFRGYSVMILNSDEFNAFASPAGHIFLTKKLVESAASEDMLAAVIAHELAHVMLRHSVAIISETRFADEMNAIADWAAGTAARNSSSASRAVNFSGSITRTVDVLMKSGYSQAQEFEADMEAVVLLSRTGYDPAALLEMLAVLQQNQQRNGLYSTHPSPEMRIANLQRLRFQPVNTARFRLPRFRNIKF